MTGRTKEELNGVSLLGNQQTTYRDDYAPEVLETFPNKHPDRDYFIKFNCPEFTSLCPMTGQPDFATIYISYVPGERCVESKSLKLYLFSFRNHGDFHEDCVNIIMNDLIRLMDPKYIEVWGKFTPPRRNLHRSLLQLRQTRHPLGNRRLEPPLQPRPLPGEGGQPLKTAFSSQTKKTPGAPRETLPTPHRPPAPRRGSFYNFE